MNEEIVEFDYENRIVSNEYTPDEDAEVEGDLRPKSLADYVGQTKAKSNLKVYIESTANSTATGNSKRSIPQLKKVKKGVI